MKKIYTCPMHPEIHQEEEGKCPICGMRLTLQSESPKEESGYRPLYIIVLLIALVAFTISLKNMVTGAFHITQLISYFMTGFFLVFSAFKLIDLRGFADGYSTYDLLAKRWYHYGYIYPFIELFFGLGMILFPSSRQLLFVEIVVMVFSGIGVAIKILKKEKFQCACLGTFLKVPLTKITLVEDFGMAVLAIILLLLGR